MTPSESARPTVTVDMRPPDFFIVGQPKSGTTALYEILRGHPQIYMAEPKEPVFLASDLHEGLWAALHTRVRTLEEYLALFAGAHSGQRTGEASTVYLWSSEAARNIAELAPEARIVAVLREPASFLRSLHLQLLRTHIETEKDFVKAISYEQDRRAGGRTPRACPWPQALFYSDRVRYAEQLRRYYDLFPRENVLVLIYDDFRADNEAAVRRVLGFLGVDESVPIQASEANQTVRLRSRRLDDVVRATYLGRGPVSRGAKAAVKAATSRRLRHTLLRQTRRRVLYADPHPPEEEFMLELRRRYRGEVVALDDLLGCDLVRRWGYDRID